MDSTLTGASLAAAAALFTTLWSAGGRAALERRSMQQELEIADSLPEGLAKRKLISVAEDRAKLYVHRRLGPGRGVRFHATMAGVASALLVSIIGLAALANVGSRAVQESADALFLVALVLLGVVAAQWIAESWRDHWAEMRKIDLASAERRLRQADPSNDG